MIKYTNANSKASIEYDLEMLVLSPEAKQFLTGYVMGFVSRATEQKQQHIQQLQEDNKYLSDQVASLLAEQAARDHLGEELEALWDKVDALPALLQKWIHTDITLEDHISMHFNPLRKKSSSAI